MAVAEIIVKYIILWWATSKTEANIYTMVYTNYFEDHLGYKNQTGKYIKILY